MTASCRPSRRSGSLCASLILHAFVVSRNADAGDLKTLTRFHDPVVIAAAALPGAVQRSSGELALYRVRNERFEPMPYQFDRRDRDGDVDVGAPATFTLDGNDELVFMAKDSGDRAGGALTAGAGAIEIEVEDPDGGGVGWAYLLPATPAPPAAEPYVRYDVERRRAGSALYDVEYADGRNFLTALDITPAGGGSGENLLRQTRMLGEPTFSLLFGDVQLTFTERNSVVRVEGVRNGAVRAVRRVHLSVDLGPLFPDLPTGVVYTFHYFSSFTTPTQMSVPWLALKTLRDFRFENVVEFSSAAAPRRYWDAANPAGTTLSGAAADAIATDRDHDWWAVGGDSGSLLQAFLVPQEWTDWGITRGTVVQRQSAAETPGRDPAGAGFTLRDMVRLQRSGSYQLLQSTVVLPQGYRPGDERQVMAMFHAPLRVRARVAGEEQQR